MSAKNEIVLETPVVLDIPEPVAEKPVRVRKAKSAKVKAKRLPGRPRVYGAKDRRRLASYLRKFGLTKGVRVLAEKGLKVSLTTAISVAKEEKITFVRGRPKAA